MKKILFSISILALSTTGLTLNTLMARAQSQYLLLSSYFLMPGQSLVVSGFNFPANTQASISAAGKTITAQTDSSGKFVSQGITIPFSATASTQQVSASVDGENASAQFGVAGFFPVVKPSSWFLIPGTQVSFSGMGFAPNETIAITSSTGASLTSATADNSGNFNSQNFNVGFAAGQQTYTFKGQNSNASFNVTLTVATWKPFIVLNNYYLPAGSQVQIKGSQFGANEKVNISIAGNQVSTVTTDNSGTFTASVTIPLGLTDSPTISATGTQTGNTATTNITINTQRQQQQGNTGQTMQNQVSVISVDRPKTNLSTGQNVTITVHLISPATQLNGVSVNIQLTDQNGNVAAQQSFTNQTLSQNTPMDFQLATPNLNAGTYTISATVYNPDGSINSQFTNLGTIVVQ